ncbi:MAG: BamA/TamA family outer membrane protein [Candidatus Azobacteroides sp.]|nr:BamA/TamA family outer membrane protein [Candidatus Azobacteroides sp.]
MESKELKDYVKQKPNYKVFDTWNMRLGIYSLSGTDTTKWINRTLKNVGSPPVIYEETQAEQTALEFQKLFFNKGYMDVQVDFVPTFKKKKVSLTYNIYPNEPYYISKLEYEIQDEKIKEIVLADTTHSIVKTGMIFDGNELNLERTRITNKLREQGYYSFTKENIHCFADSFHVSHQVKLKISIRNIPFGVQIVDTIQSKNIQQNVYYVNNVYFLVDDGSRNARRRGTEPSLRDTLLHEDYYIIQRNNTFRPSFLLQNCFIRPHSRYNETDVSATYNSLASLQALQYANIRFQETDSAVVDCYISLTSSKTQTASISLEGTNSAGDLGVAGSISYQHRNIFKASDVFNIKLRGAYEALSGSISDLLKNSYKEIGTETSVIFPKFQFPFLNKDLKKRLRASTEYGLAFGWQERPEYERIVFSGSWKYNWSINNGRFRHSISPLFFDYVHIPRMTKTFEDDLNQYPALLHSFEDHVISGVSYSYYTSNLGFPSSKKSLYSIKAAVETSGNLLYGISTLSNAGKNDKGQYRLFDVPISQYIKGDFDFAKTHIIDQDNSLTYHIGVGLAYPYKNATIMPFEKRYYSGGANSVRGWSVRTLGPGTYQYTGQALDYANQAGDIRLDMNIEWRSHIFWLFQLAGYIDAGNIWTIKSYESQPGGVFKFNEFYKQIAASYGLGLRLDFNYFLIRLDTGIKAYDPGLPNDPWVMFKPKFSRDFALHFAIGYPF